MKRVAPKQSRSIEAERKFMQAAEQVFADKGYAGARVSDIVKLAGSSTGNFYFRFKNKEALFDYMLEQYLERARLAVQVLPEKTTSVADLVAWIVVLNGRLLNENLGFYRAINEVSIRSPETWLQLRSLTDEVAHNLLTSAADLLHEIPDTNPRHRLQQAVQFITGSMANQAIHHADRQLLEAQNIDMHFRAGMGILGICPVPAVPNIED